MELRDFRTNISIFVNCFFSSQRGLICVLKMRHWLTPSFSPMCGLRIGNIAFVASTAATTRKLDTNMQLILTYWKMRAILCILYTFVYIWLQQRPYRAMRGHINGTIDFFVVAILDVLFNWSNHWSISRSQLFAFARNAFSASNFCSFNLHQKISAR